MRRDAEPAAGAGHLSGHTGGAFGKGSVIDALIQSSLEEFGRHGYEGASLRAIASRANATLSTINRYFGTKRELFIAVEQWVWDDLNVEREHLLAEALATETPMLSSIMTALIAPVVHRALEGEGLRRYTVEMLRANAMSRRLLGEDDWPRGYATISKRWFKAIQCALPNLPHDMLVWCFSFALGATYSWQLIDRHFETMLRHEQELEASTITAMLVTFCTGGFQAVEARKE